MDKQDGQWHHAQILNVIDEEEICKRIGWRLWRDPFLQWADGLHWEGQAAASRQRRQWILELQAYCQSRRSF
jgi:hypothetical protein